MVDDNIILTGFMGTGKSTVGADGKPKACMVTGSSGWPALDATACAKIMARANFDPATGSDGEKSAGTWNSAVQWQIPE